MEPHNLEALPEGIAFIAFFVAVWVGVMTLAGRHSHWYRLSKELRRESGMSPLGGDKTTFRFLSGRLGWSRFKNCVTVQTSRQGLSLKLIKIFSFGHPPIFIPWQSILSITQEGLFFIPHARVALNDSKYTVLELPSKVFEDNPHVPAQLQGAVKETENPYDHVSS